MLGVVFGCYRIMLPAKRVFYFLKVVWMKDPTLAGSIEMFFAPAFDLLSLSQ